MDENGVPLDVKFHLEIIAFQPSFYDIGNVCGTEDAATDVTVTITVTFTLICYWSRQLYIKGNATSKSKQNSTACQIEIRKLATVLWVETTQQSPNIDPADEDADYIAKVDMDNLDLA